MSQRKIAAQAIQTFQHDLLSNEKSTATVETYLRDVRAFSRPFSVVRLLKNARDDWLRYGTVDWENANRHIT